MFDHSKKLKELPNTSEGLSFHYRDLGWVVPQQLCYNIAYIGPTLMVPLFYFYSKEIYGQE
jgi:hypothetical protein